MGVGDVPIVMTKVESDGAVVVESLIGAVMLVASTDVGVDVADSVGLGGVGMDVKIGLNVAIGLDVVIGLNAVRVLLVVAVELKRDDESDNSVETVLLVVEDDVEEDIRAVVGSNVESVSEEVGMAEVDWVGGSVGGLSGVLSEVLSEALENVGIDCSDEDGNGLGVSIGAVVVDLGISEVESMGDEVSVGTMVKMEVNVVTGVNEKEGSLSVVEDKGPTKDNGEMFAVAASWVVDAWMWMVEVSVLVVVLVVVVVVS